MKNFLVVVGAVGLLVLGWFLLFSDQSDVDVASGGSVDAAPEEGPKPDERRVGGPARESIAGPKRKVGASEEEAEKKPTDPGLGSLDLRVVFRKTGKPVPHARVLVSSRGMSWGEQRVLEADEKGRVRIEDLSPGGIYVKALRGGERGFTITAGETKRAQLGVPTGVVVKVVVADADGVPIEKASVWLSERYRDNRGAVAGGTDYRGEFELQHVSPHCSVAVRCEGYEPSRIHRVRASIGGSVRVPVTLQRGGGMLGGIVVDDRGEPVPKAQVLVGAERPSNWQRTEDGSWVPGPPPILRVTDAKGRFTARMSASGRQSIQIRHAEHAPFQGEIEATAGAPVTRRFVLTPGAVLFGNVHDEKGEPAPFARVMIGDPNAFAGRFEFADKDGGFELRGIAAGEQKAVASNGKARAETSLRFAVGQRTEWNPTVGDVLAKDGKKLLVGRVVDAQNKPLERWRVAVRGAANPGVVQATNTDAQGRFRIAVKWDEVRVWTHAPGAHSGFPALIRDGVRVGDGELELRVADPALRVGEIRGVVIDAAGRFVQAQVQVWHHEVRLWRTFKTDAKTGAFRIENLPPGKLELKVTSDAHPWLKLPDQTITAGQRIDLGRLTLQSGGRIEGSVRLVGGREPKELKIGVYHEKGGEAGVANYVDGKYRTGSLAAGKYTLQVQGDRVGTQTVAVVVRAGTNSTKNFVLQPAALRELRFTIAQGIRPPPFLSVLVREKKRGTLAGNFGLRAASGKLTGKVSLVPGDYTVRVWAPGPKSWLAAPLKVTSLVDTEALDFVLQPKR